MRIVIPGLRVDTLLAMSGLDNDAIGREATPAKGLVALGTCVRSVSVSQSVSLARTRQGQVGR